jgi:hypothetical protein
MNSRSLTIPALLAAAVAAPYAANKAPEWKSKRNAGAQPAPATTPAPATPSSLWPAQGLAAHPAPNAASMPGVPAMAVAAPVQAPLEGTPTYSLAEVFRLDVTKEWVYQRWARKSTALSELDLFGVRVPLVTGTRLHDLAGSLTYFFTPDGRLQRISFRGRTGDTTQIVALLTQQYGFQWQTPTAAGEQLMQIRRGDEILGELRTRPAAVLWSNSSNNSFSVNVELQNPATARPLKPILAPLPASVAAAAPANPQTAAASGGKEPAAKADDKPAEPGWKAFFPRSRTPEGQLENLDRANMYR